MTRRALVLLMLVTMIFLLAGCLFTLNDPLVAPDGMLAVFLDAEGAYSLFPESATLHLYRGDKWISVPDATIEEAGGLVGLSPDGAEALYVDVGTDVDSGDWGELFTPFVSTLYRCALQPDAAPEAVLQTASAIAKAEWTRWDRILLLLFGETELGSLHALDPTTDRVTLVAEDLLSFAALPGTDELLLLAGRPEAELPLGGVVRWDPETGARRALATFALSEGTIESFAALPHRLFWDVSPDGRWIALGLYDATFVTPAVETELPALYLVDLETGEAERLASEALMPAFAPDGSGLIYAVEAAGGDAVLMWRAFTAETPVEVPGSEGVSTVFWLSPTTLGMTFEVDEDRFRMVELDVETEEIHVLIDVAHNVGE